MTDVQNQHKELRELAEYALRRPVARNTGVRITTVEAKALAEGVIALEEQLETLREVLREITATNWREIKDGVAYNQDTPFQFEQRIHKIAADALMGIGSNPASVLDGPRARARNRWGSLMGPGRGSSPATIPKDKNESFKEHIS